MRVPKQSPALAGGPGLGNETQAHHITRARRPRKWQRVLTALHAGKSFNRFQAERELADHCLNTTISILQGKGLTISRRDEIVPGFQNIPTHVNRYWLAPESYAKARELLGLLAAAPREQLDLLDADTGPRSVDRAESVGEHQRAPVDVLEGG
jgi:hypothetical protein